MNELEISLDAIDKIKKLEDILCKALKTGDEVMFDNYVQVTDFTIALNQAIYFITEWQEEHGYIKL